MKKRLKMNIFIWLPEYGLIKDGQVHIYIIISFESIRYVKYELAHPLSDHYPTNKISIFYFLIMSMYEHVIYRRQQTVSFGSKCAYFVVF